MEESTHTEPKLRTLLFTGIDERTVQNLEVVRGGHPGDSMAQVFRRSVALTHFVDTMMEDGFELLIRRKKRFWYGHQTYKVLIP